MSKMKRTKKPRKPLNIEHSLAFNGGTARVETVESTWGALPSSPDNESREEPGVILSCCHGDPGAQESTLALDADELDELIGSLVEARDVLSDRHGLPAGGWVYDQGARAAARKG